MRIDLFYDPVRPYTFVMIDGEPVSPSDIYGFLYPVRGYALQAWLFPSGSWRGLKNELMDLTREEPSRIVFHGRETDYRDFERAAEGLPGCVCEFEQKDYTALSGEILAMAEKLLGAIVNTPVVMERDESETTRTFAELFPEQAARLKELEGREEGSWLSEIHDRAGLSRCLNGDGCCLIDGDRMLSYENYGLIDALTAGLKRSPDMLVCAFSSGEKKAEFSNYNAQYKNHAVTVIRGDETGWEEALRAKYGIPWEYRRKLTELRNCCEVLTACFEAGAEGGAGGESASDARQIRNALRLRQKKRWAAYQKNHLNSLRRLLYGVDYFQEGGRNS